MKDVNELLKSKVDTLNIYYEKLKQYREEKSDFFFKKYNEVEKEFIDENMEDIYNISALQADVNFLFKDIADFIEVLNSLEIEYDINILSENSDLTEFVSNYNSNRNNMLTNVIRDGELFVKNEKENKERYEVFKENFHIFNQQKN